VMQYDLCFKTGKLVRGCRSFLYGLFIGYLIVGTQNKLDIFGLG